MVYQLISSKEDLESSSSSEDLTNLEKYRSTTRRKYYGWIPTLLSVLLNIIFASSFLRLQYRGQMKSSQASQYASLEPDIYPPFQPSTVYSSENLEVASDAWERLNSDSGMVALDQDYIKSHSLPASQAFPWDPTKSVYMINAYHALHCVKIIHTALMEFKSDKPQTYDFPHIMHCVDDQRIETMCHADDTPRFMTSLKEVGDGQHRQCRSWEKLESFAQEHTACYQFLNYSINFSENQLQRFVFCPPGSPYSEQVESYLKRKELGDDNVESDE